MKKLPFLTRTLGRFASLMEEREPYQIAQLTLAVNYITNFGGFGDYVLPITGFCLATYLYVTKGGITWKDLDDIVTRGISIRIERDKRYLFKK